MRREKNFASNNNLVYKIFVDSRNNSSIIYQSEEIIQRNSNAIKEIERNIELIKNTETEDIYGLANLIINRELKNARTNQKLLDELGDIKLQLSEANLYFTKNDILIKRLKDKLYSQSEQLRIIIINTLNNEKNLLINQIDSSYIEPDIISNHMRLVADADQKNILSSLTREKIQISLFNEIDQDPWKLITNPTLFPNSIKPSKSIYGGIDY